MGKILLSLDVQTHCQVKPRIWTWCNIWHHMILYRLQTPYHTHIYIQMYKTDCHACKHMHVCQSNGNSTQWMGGWWVSLSKLHLETQLSPVMVLIFSVSRTRIMFLEISLFCLKESILAAAALKIPTMHSGNNSHKHIEQIKQYLPSLNRCWKNKATECNENYDN